MLTWQSTPGLIVVYLTAQNNRLALIVTDGS